MKPRPNLFLSLICICLFFCSQVFSQKVFKDALPPDFNCKGCVLVVLKKEPDQNIHKLNEMTEKKLIGNYDGQSIFVTATELATNSLYKDSTKYRFILNGEPYAAPGARIITKANGRPGDFNYTMTAINFHFYDRLTKKGYPQLSNYPAWAKNMEKIAEALNKLLKN